MHLYVVDLGLTPYDVAWAFQKRARAARISGALDQDLLILVQQLCKNKQKQSSKRLVTLAQSVLHIVKPQVYQFV